MNVIIESSLSRIWQKYKEHDSGTISASRGENTKKQNQTLTLALKTELIKLGYSVTKVKGKFIETYKTDHEVVVKEDSFVVSDQYDRKNLRKDLIKLGQKYKQESITFCDVNTGDYFLIGTNSGYPGKGKIVKLGKPMFGDDGEFTSYINGRPFIFEQLYQNYYDYDCSLTSYNISTIRAIKTFNDYTVNQ